MTKLFLGVVDIPYVDENGVTTGEVAQFLENKYHIMEVFYETHKNEIVDNLTKSLVGSLENILLGAPPGPSPFLSTESYIDSEFKNFLALSTIETYGIPGVPTKAALNGVNRRKKKKYNVRNKNKKSKRRPSFIDTGMYQASFKSWFD